MTLDPGTRVMLTDALCPPPGYRVANAIATTYSLDLTTLMTAPLAFAMYDVGDTLNAAVRQRLQLLEALRRHSENLTVFCQAGAIHDTDLSSQRHLFTFIEDAVVEANGSLDLDSPTLFHPKIWVLRFEGHRTSEETPAHLHRLVVASRNITGDDSWDTALVLDQSVDGAISAEPLVGFLDALRRAAMTPLASRHQDNITAMTSSLTGVRFAVPEPYTSGELLPIGLGFHHVWPFPASARRVLAISPFLTQSAVHKLGALSHRNTLVSRQDSLESLGPSGVEQWKDIRVLSAASWQPETDDVPGEIGADARTGPGENAHFGVGKGSLHAKTYVVDEDDGTSLTVTGSANLTSPTWGGSTEFAVALRGPSRECGVGAVLGDNRDDGLARVLAPTVVEERVPLEGVDAARNLERFHQRLAAGAPQMCVRAMSDDRACVEWSLTAGFRSEDRELVALTSIGPTGSAARSALGESASWTIERDEVTPFVTVSTAQPGDPDAPRRTCILRARLTGDIGDRRARALRELVRGPDAVVSYLAYLLADPARDPTAMWGDSPLLGAGSADSLPASEGQRDIPVELFEPLIRAFSRDPGALERIASFVDDLHPGESDTTVYPEGFDALWSALRDASGGHQ